MGGEHYGLGRARGPMETRDPGCRVTVAGRITAAWPGGPRSWVFQPLAPGPATLPQLKRARARGSDR
jgi:hypothetical protein